MGGGKGMRYESGISHLRNSMTGVCVGPVLAIAGIYLIFCEPTHHLAKNSSLYAKNSSPIREFPGGSSRLDA